MIHFCSLVFINVLALLWSSQCIKLFKKILSKMHNKSLCVFQYLIVCCMYLSGSWAVKVASIDHCGRPSSSLTCLGLGSKFGLSFTSMTRMDTVDVDWRVRWIPLASGTSFSATTVSMNDRFISKSIGCTQEHTHKHTIKLTERHNLSGKKSKWYNEWIVLQLNTQRRNVWIIINEWLILN